MSRRRRSARGGARRHGGRVFAFTDSECGPQVDTITSILAKYSCRLSEIKMDHRNYLRKQMVRLTGGQTEPPQFFLNSEYLGPATRLIELDRSDELGERLSAIKSDEPGELYDVYRNQQLVFDVFPNVLYFPHPENRTIRTVVVLSNKTQLHGVFKVKTTKPQKYSVKPRFGVVPKDGEQRIEITLQRKSDRPPSGGRRRSLPPASGSDDAPNTSATTAADEDEDDPSTDKFRIESFGIRTPVAGEEMINSLFDRVKRVQQQRLPCEFGDPPDYIKVTQEKLNVFLVEEDRERHMQQAHVAQLSQQFLVRKKEEARRREEAALRKRREADEEARREERERRAERERRERERREREREERRKSEEAERLAEIARQKALAEVENLRTLDASTTADSASSLLFQTAHEDSIRAEIAAAKSSLGRRTGGGVSPGVSSRVMMGSGTSSSRGRGGAGGGSAKKYSDAELRAAIDSRMKEIRAESASGEDTLRSRIHDKDSVIEGLTQQVRQLKETVQRLTKELSGENGSTDDSSSTTGSRAAAATGLTLKYVLVISLVLFLLGLLFGRRFAQ